MAPEVMVQGDLNEKVDIYSYGIILWELLTEEEPFEEIQSFDELIDLVAFDVSSIQSFTDLVAWSAFNSRVGRYSIEKFNSCLLVSRSSRKTIVF